MKSLKEIKAEIQKILDENNCCIESIYIEDMSQEYACLTRNYKYEILEKK